MARMTIDCRTMPSEANCSLTLTGETEEVLRAAAAHAVDVHGHTDDDELRDGLRSALTPAAALELEPGAFVQLIDFRTRRMEDFERTDDAWADAIGADRTARWSVTCANRAEQDRYMQIVGFPDLDSAMANSKHPATARFAEMLRELCEGDPGFHDLIVRQITVY
jgi:hypothetical protein